MFSVVHFAYGPVVGYAVIQRTREIDVRMALGGCARRHRAAHGGAGRRPAAAGIVVGLFAAVGLTRLLSGILFGITPTDPVTFAEVVALLVVVVLLASYLPARRAASVDPQVVLREG